MSSQPFNPQLNPRVPVTDSRLTNFARLSGVLPDHRALTPELRHFALHVMEKCAGIGDLYPDLKTGVTAGDEIRALFGVR